MILLRRLGFCLGFRCGASDSISKFDPAPRINTGAAPRILSRIPVRRFGFCLGFRCGASDRYWCGASDSVSCFVRRFGFCLVFRSGAPNSVTGFDPAPRNDTGAASRIPSLIPFRNLRSILVQRLGFCLLGFIPAPWINTGAAPSNSVSSFGLAPRILSCVPLGGLDRY